MASLPKKNEVIASDPSQLAAGTVIDGRYKVQRVIGVGGTGIVYEVEHLRTGQALALKTLLDPSHSARLEQEARALAKLKSTHIVKVVDLGTHAPTRGFGAKEPPSPFMVMSLLRGRNLRELLETRLQLDLGFVANVIVQVCEGLEEAHGAGLVHRDLKPDNVHLTTDKANVVDVAKEIVFATVFDFGVVKLTAAELNNPLTRTGSTVGTPYYMSLEQLRGAGTVDTQTDIYALCVMAYECLAAKRPFEAGTLGDLIFAICSTQPTPLRDSRPEIPEALEKLIMRGLAREKGERPKTMREVAEAFAPYADASFTLWLRDSDLSKAMVSRAGSPAVGATVSSTARGGTDPGVEERSASDKPTAPLNNALLPALGSPLLPKMAPPAPSSRGALPAVSAPAPAMAPAAMAPAAMAPAAMAPPAHAAMAPPAVSAGPASAAPVAPSAPRPVAPRPALRVDGDRETPTEMFTQDMHGDGDGVDIDPPTGVARLAPLEASAPANEDRTAVLSLAEVVLSEPVLHHSQALPVHPPSQPNASPVFGPPSEGHRASLASLDPKHAALQTQAIPPNLLVAAQQSQQVPKPPMSQPGFAQTQPSPIASSAAPPHQPDRFAVFLEQLRVRGTETAFDARMKFRAATPEQQIVLVAVGTALLAVVVVLLVWLVFLR